VFPPTRFAPVLTLAVWLAACVQTAPRTAADALVSVSRAPFGVLADGTAVEKVSLGNRHGLAVTVITYGATVQSLHFPDRNGVDADLAAGYDTLAGYETTPGYTNVTVGRYARHWP
jgi:aldose 1-epimerase